MQLGRSEFVYPSPKIWKIAEYEHVGAFFSLNGDKSIFEGLKIAGETVLCEEYMGKYPVVSVSLKGMDAPDFERLFC